MNELTIVTLDYPLSGLSWANYVGTGSLKTIFGSDKPNGVKYILTTDTMQYGEFAECYTFDWTLENGTLTNIIEDIESAKCLFIKYIREARTPILSKLDVDYMKALESGNQTIISQIANKKQQLRDLPNINLTDVTSFSQFKNKWPVELLGEYPYEN
jgi:hypothetical protein